MDARTQEALERLSAEIALNRPFASEAEGAFLALAWTWQRLEQVGRTFFPRYGITEAQFNVLMILHDYPGRAFRQHELADILVVNRASAGSVIERLERNGWIVRSPDPDDRRALRVEIAPAGEAKLREVRAPYYRLMQALFAEEDPKELGRLVLFCDRMRAAIARLEPAS